MAAVFVLDRSAETPSPLVQRLCRAGYHTLHLADCESALAAFRCLRPELLVVDAAAMPSVATEGLLKLLNRYAERASPALPVLVVGTKQSDYRRFASQLGRGEILPTVYSAPDDVLTRVRQYVSPKWPPATEGCAELSEPNADTLSDASPAELIDATLLEAEEEGSVNDDWPPLGGRLNFL